MRIQIKKYSGGFSVDPIDRPGSPAMGVGNTMDAIAAQVPRDWKAQHLRQFFTIEGKTVFAYDKAGIDYLMNVLEGCAPKVVHDNKTGG